MKKCLCLLFAGIALVFSQVSSHGAEPGTLKWSYTMGSAVTSSPAIGADGTIYVGSWDNHLHAINPDGTGKWSYNTGDGIMSSPAIGPDGTIYVGSNNGTIYAIKDDGKLKWSYYTGSYSTMQSSPAIGTDGTIYVGSWDGKLYAVKSNGTPKWSFTTGGQVRTSPAIGADGTVYVGSIDGKLYALHPDSGALKWFYTASAGIYTSPVIGPDGTIYTGTQDYNVLAISPVGTLAWSYTTGQGIGGCPALGNDGTIYVGSADNKLYALTSAGSFSWSYTTGGFVQSCPAIGSDGTVYVGSNDSKFYAFNSLSSGLATSPWPIFHHDLKHTGALALALTVSKSGTGSGTVTSSPSGIDCGSTCSASFNKNVKVILTPVPDGDSVFAGWGGDCTGKGTCTVTMSKSRSVQATFNKGSCAYSLSSSAKKLTYKGGKITVGVTVAKDDAFCVPPAIEISVSDSAWITATATTLNKNKGTVKITVSGYDLSAGRTGTVAIGVANTYTITQTGQTCALKPFNPKSDSFTSITDTGEFTVTATPSDCAWEASADPKSGWITVPPGTTGAGQGHVTYTVQANTTGKPRSGKIIVKMGKKTGTFSVKQGK